LQKVLDEAIAASTAVRDLDDLLKHFGGIYAAGRRFVRAIERVAADPVSPVRATLREIFNNEVSKLLSDLGSVAASIRAALADLESKARAEIKRLVTDEALAAWRKLVFALPIARADSDTERVRTAVERALVAALNDDEWLDALADDGADKAAEVIARKLRAELQGPANASIRTAIDNALKDWDATLADARDRIQGFLFRQVMTVLRIIFAEARRLARDGGTFDINAVRGALEALAKSAVDLVQPALDNQLLAARTMCQDALAVFKGLLTAAAPKVTGVLAVPTDVLDAVGRVLPALDTLATSVAEYRATVPPADTALATALDTLKGKVETLRRSISDASDTVKKAADGLQSATRQFAAGINALSDEVCTLFNPADVPKLPLDALSALGAPRAALIEALAGLAKAVSGLQAPFGDADGILAVLSAADGDLGLLGAVLPSPKTRAVRNARAAMLELATLSSFLVRVVQETSTLKTPDATIVELRNKIAALADRLQPMSPAAAQRLREALLPHFRDLLTLMAETRGRIKEVTDEAEKVRNEAANTVATLRQRMAELKKAADDASKLAEGLAERLVNKLERALMAAAAERLVAGEQIAGALAASSFGILQPALKALAEVQANIVTLRDTLFGQIPSDGQASQGNQSLEDFLRDLSKATLADLARLLLVARPAGARPRGLDEDEKPTSRARDYLTVELKELRALADRPKLTPTDTAAIVAMFADWGAGRASATLLIDTLKRAAERVLSGDLARVVDLDGARRRIETKLKEMIPSKVSLSYDFSAEMRDVRNLFIPRGDKRLTVAAAASIDLLAPEKPPVFTATATMSPFDISLFNVITLMFRGARFVNDSRKGSDFNLAYDDYKLGPQAEFIKPLEDYLNPKGSGPYVRLLRGSPGIEAGYSLDLGIISIGNVSFSNVSLNASCRLPFDKKQAVFSTSIGRRDKPFLISAAPYTGGGFLGLLANSKRIIGFEASFEFGGGGAFKFGLLEGQGRITLGIYVNQIDSPGDGPQGATIDGFFYAGGEAHISCFAICATLVVRISQQPGGSMQGSAVFTYSFSLGFTDIEFKIGVQKKEGKGFSGGGSSAAFESGRTRFAQVGSGAVPARSRPTGAKLVANAVSQRIDWKQYQSYFTDDIDGFAA
jgi:hypothetical protein